MLSGGAMFGGYADVAAYYYDADLVPSNTALERKTALPVEYQPVWSMPDPWHSNSQCRHDFILVAEFSEIEGPVPLKTIPSNVGGRFDLNDFVVRIMSVDSQSQASDTFRMHKDSCVVMSDAHRHVFSYVHNLTLYDSKARGFVRPFCIAYVTADNWKLRQFHEEIEDQISQVSEALKQGNLHVFVQDMTRHRADLQYTQEKYLERIHAEDFNMVDLEGSASEEDLIFLSLSEEGLELAIKEVRHILCTVNNLLSLQQHGGLPTCSTPERLFQMDPISQVNDPSKPGHTDPLEEFAKLSMKALDDSAISSLNLNTSACSSESSSLARRRCKSFSGGLTLRPPPRPDTYQPKLVGTHNKRRYDKTLRTLEELCTASAKQGLGRLSAIQRHFSKDLATLKREKRDAGILSPQKGLLTFGGNVQLNYLPDDRRSVGCLSDLLSDEASSFASAVSFLSCCEDLSGPHVVLHSDLEHQKSVPTSSPNSSLTTFDTSSLLNISFDGSRYPDSADVLVVPQPSAHSGEPASLNSSLTSSLDSVLTDYSLTNMAANSLATAPSNREELTSSMGSSDHGDVYERPVKVFSLPDQLHTLNRNTPGYGLKRFMDTFSFLQHVLFSLLCGRPLIVVAKTTQEDSVTSALTTLAFFLTAAPGDIQSALTIHRSALTELDLEKRLIGLVHSSKVPKDTLIPKEIKHQCSVLDLDRRVYYGPCYLGGVLTEVYSRRKVHDTDHTYLAYIQVILNNLAMKSFVFYHTFIQNVATKLPHMYARPEEARVAYSKAQQHFLDRMKVSSHDTEIIKYLAEVMHRQIDGQWLQLAGIATSTMEKIPCQVFKE